MRGRGSPFRSRPKRPNQVVGQANITSKDLQRWDALTDSAEVLLDLVGRSEGLERFLGETAMPRDTCCLTLKVIFVNHMQRYPVKINNGKKKKTAPQCRGACTSLGPLLRYLLLQSKPYKMFAAYFQPLAFKAEFFFADSIINFLIPFKSISDKI